jgi:hypothetical protein
LQAVALWVDHKVATERVLESAQQPCWVDAEMRFATL